MKTETQIRAAIKVLQHVYADSNSLNVPQDSIGMVSLLKAFETLSWVADDPGGQAFDLFLLGLTDLLRTEAERN